MSKKGMMTTLTHAGEKDMAKKIAKSVSVPKVVPIYMNSVFSFDDVETLDDVYEHRAEGYVYTRNGNPAYDTVEEVLAMAEGAKGAVVFSSGMAAIINTLLSQLNAGDHIIADPVLYGGVYGYMKNELPRFGIEVTFADFETADLQSLIKSNTKLLYCETISNPLMGVVDLREIAALAHKNGLKLVVDNTFASPCVCKPLDLGVDIVVYSATKYLNGHSDITGGVALTNDDADLAAIRHQFALYGAIMGPMESWLLTRSMRTLELRMERHSKNALKIAEFFEKHPKIEKVYYPGLESSKYKALTKELFFEGRCGGMLSADIAGGEKGASTFIRECESVKFVPSLAGVATSISYPAKTSHRSLTAEEMAAVGISMGQLRFSIGLEDIDDIIEEFDKALAKV